MRRLSASLRRRRGDSTPRDPVPAFCLVSHISVSVIGGILALFAVYSWAFEPATAPEAPEHSKKEGAY